MSEVILTQSRAKDYSRHKDFDKKTDPDDLPTFEPMRYRVRGLWGERNDRKRIHFAPFIRFLRSRVGKPWSEVFGEIERHADHRSYGGHNLLKKIDWIVSDYTYLYAECSRFVIDANGILQQGNNWPRWKAYRYQAPPPDTIYVGSDFCYYNDKGVWYGVKLARLEDAPPDTVDAVTRQAVVVDYPKFEDIINRYGFKERVRVGYTRHRHKLYTFAGDRYAVSKLALNKKELERAGLRNND
jgi:hypothetical protein